MTLALVTGGSRGIGRATAVELARRGYTVAIVYRQDASAASSAQAEVEAVGGTAHLFCVDVSDAAAVAALFTELDAVGPLEVVVANAGITRDTLLGASEPDDYQALFAVNVQGVVNVCREASRRMMSRRRGSLVTVSSVAAQRPGRGQSNYAASKGAIESFTRALAVELAPRKIRVNGVAPGIIETDMTAELVATVPDELVRRSLMKRLGAPAEVARVIAFLASDDASYVTGQIWNVDGGFKLE